MPAHQRNLHERITAHCSKHQCTMTCSGHKAGMLLSPKVSERRRFAGAEQLIPGSNFTCNLILICCSHNPAADLMTIIHTGMPAVRRKASNRPQGCWQGNHEVCCSYADLGWRRAYHHVLIYSTCNGSRLLCQTDLVTKAGAMAAIASMLLIRAMPQQHHPCSRLVPPIAVASGVLLLTTCLFHKSAALTWLHYIGRFRL